jgi:hypothetical protein
MNTYSKQYADTGAGTMDTDTIQKNGTREKRHTGRGNAMLIVALLAVLCAVHTAGAQTYQYRYLHTADNDGVKTKGSGSDVYVTFTNSQNVCYFSDRNGNKSEYDGVYHYNENSLLYKSIEYVYDVEAETKRKFPCQGYHQLMMFGGGELKCMNCASAEGYIAGIRFSHGTTKLRLIFSKDFTRMEDPNYDKPGQGRRVYERADASLKEIQIY